MVLSHIIIFSSKVYDKQYYFNFEIVNLPFLDGNVPCSSSYSVYILQLTRFEMVSSTVVPARSDSDLMFCLQSYQGLRIDRSLVY